MTWFWPKVIVAWLLLSTVLIAMFWAVTDGIDPDAVALIVVLIAALSAGVTAGALCWGRGHRVIGAMGILAPVAPVAGHFLAIRFGPTEDVWAPTLVGDVLGVALGLVLSMVAVIAAVAIRSTGRRPNRHGSVLSRSGP